MPISSRRRSFLSRLFAGAGAAAAAGAAAQAQPRGGAASLPGGLDQLFLARPGRRRRESSWDRTGKNADRYVVEPGQTHTLADIQGPGCVRHIWITISDQEPHYLRRLVLRAYWDGETSPSVECPVGDFFGVGHARVSNFWSMPLTMVTGGGAMRNQRAAMNCFFPMPFAKSARITIENQGAQPVGALYYYVDWESLPALPEGSLLFHAQWRRENPTRSALEQAQNTGFPRSNEIVNLDGKDNYTLLEATGRGHYVGCVLSIDHLDPIPGFPWFGEGDDMIFIDGEAMPSLIGTGTEDYFCAAWGYPGGFNPMPYHGISLAGPTEGPGAYSGKWTMYRFHIEDPVMFSKSIRVTIEHGHGNVHASDFSSVAYWYQTAPHAPFPPLPPVDARLPVPDDESLRSYMRNFARK
jgi:hypothetical protein